MLFKMKIRYVGMQLSRVNKLGVVLCPRRFFVIPAKAGIQLAGSWELAAGCDYFQTNTFWIEAKI